MIKVRTIGMLDHAVTNPTLKSENDVANYTFMTVDGDLYLIANNITGDDAYKDDVTIKAGDCLLGWLIKPFESQEIVADDKHIAYANGSDFDDITAGPTLVTVNESGKLAVANAAPQSGIYFKCVGKTTLVGDAVILKVVVA